MAGGEQPYRMRNSGQSLATGVARSHRGPCSGEDPFTGAQRGDRIRSSGQDGVRRRTVKPRRIPQKNVQALQQFAAGMLGRFVSFDEQGDEYFFFLVFSDYDFCFCFTGDTCRHLDLLRQKPCFQLEGGLLVLGADGDQIAFLTVLLRIFFFF